MFEDALEQNNFNTGLFIRLSLLIKKITAFKFGEVVRAGNTVKEDKQLVQV